MAIEASALDERGTTPEQATEMLQKLLHAFENDKGKLAVALGRDEEEVGHALSGNSEAFDDDLVMKIRGLAQQRGVDLE